MSPAWIREQLLLKPLQTAVFHKSANFLEWLDDFVGF